MTLSQKDTIEEATLRKISQDPVHTCWDSFGVDDFNLDWYVKNVNTLLDTPYSKTSP